MDPLSCLLEVGMNAIANGTVWFCCRHLPRRSIEKVWHLFAFLWAKVETDPQNAKSASLTSKHIKTTQQKQTNAKKQTQEKKKNEFDRKSKQKRTSDRQTKNI